MTEKCLLGKVKAKKQEYDLMESLFVRLGEDAHVANYLSMDMLDLSLFLDRPEEERMAEMEQRFPELAKHLRREHKVSDLVYGFCKNAALQGHAAGKAEGIKVGEARGIKVGEARGRKAGKAEGIKVGRAEGKTAGKTDMLRIAIKKNGWTPEQAFDFFDIPKSNRGEYAELLK